MTALFALLFALVGFVGRLVFFVALLALIGGGLDLFRVDMSLAWGCLWGGLGAAIVGVFLSLVCIDLAE